MARRGWRRDHQRGDLAFHVRALSKIYPTAAGDVRALDGVDLDIRRGEMLVLLGPSGSGKSTLLNILGGLDRATSGEVLFEGRDLVKLSDGELTSYRRHAVGFVFQFFNLTPSLTARENVELITEIADNPMKPEEALALVGLSDRLDHFPAELSGGQQQRVAVARALASHPSFVLADEPTANLDTKSAMALLELMEHLNHEHGMTFLVSTHDARVIQRAHRVVTLEDGTVKSDVMNTQAHA